MKLPKGFIKLKIGGENWIVDPSGMRWEENPINNMNHEDALSYAKSTKTQIPSKYDFHRLLGYFNSDKEFFSVFKKWKNKAIWSSSVVPGYSYDAYYFSGRSGNFYYGYRNVYYYLVVRCAGR